MTSPICLYATECAGCWFFWTEIGSECWFFCCIFSHCSCDSSWRSLTISCEYSRQVQTNCRVFLLIEIMLPTSVSIRVFGNYKVSILRHLKDYLRPVRDSCNSTLSQQDSTTKTPTQKMKEWQILPNFAPNYNSTQLTKNNCKYNWTYKKWQFASYT